MAESTRNYFRGRVLPGAYSDALRPGERGKRYEVNGNMTAAGVEISTDEVLHIDTVLACVRVLSESMASLPLDLLERDGSGSRTPATSHPVYELMRWQTNDEMTSYEFRLWLMYDAIIHGAGYAQIRRDGRGNILDMWPLCSRNVRSYRAPDDGRQLYTYSPSGTKNKKAKEVLLEANEVLRIQLLPCGGLLKASIIELQREALGASKASEQYSSEFFSNGGVVSGVIELAEELSEPAYLRLKTDWKAAHAQRGKRHGVPILEGGAKFNPLALNHEETQLLETRKFQRSTIAGLFRVPAHLINDLEKATFSNIEHQDLSYVKHSLSPWMTNWEQRLRMTLLSPKEKKSGMYFKHNDRALLRGDFPTRMDGYSKGIMSGIYSPNDVREAEDMNKYPGGDDYFVNGTLVRVKDVGKVPVKPAREEK